MSRDSILGIFVRFVHEHHTTDKSVFSNKFYDKPVGINSLNLMLNDVITEAKFEFWKCGTSILQIKNPS